MAQAVCQRLDAHLFLTVMALPGRGAAMKGAMKVAMKAVGMKAAMKAAMKAPKAMKAMKAMKAVKAMKTMKKAMKAKRSSVVARGKLARSIVWKGSKQKTVGGL